MDTFEKLRTSGKLTDAEKALVAYILDNPEQVIRISARDLASRVHTNAMTPSRLARKLGFQNFNDLKIHIVQDLKTMHAGDLRLKDSDVTVSVVNKLASLNALAIARTRDALSLEAVDKAADILRQAEIVDLFARDANATTARYASYFFAYAGKCVSLYDDMDRMVFHSFSVPTSHACVFLSRRGSDKDLLECANNMRQRGVATIAILGEPGSPLGEACDVVLGALYSVGTYALEIPVFHTSAKYVLDLLVSLSAPSGLSNLDELPTKFNEAYLDRLDRGR